jgi:hypothetical protein
MQSTRGVGTTATLAFPPARLVYAAAGNAVDIAA